MKPGLLFTLLLIIFTTGCNSPISEINNFSSIQVQSQYVSNDLRIINSKITINRGDFGFITIEGIPQTKYRITTSFNKGGKIISVTQLRVTGPNGQATFNWFVDYDTLPGTYQATISGGGKSLSIYHTVNP